MQTALPVDLNGLVRQVAAIEDDELRYTSAQALSSQLAELSRGLHRIRADAVEALCRRGYSQASLAGRFGLKRASIQYLAEVSRGTRPRRSGSSRYVTR
jgi:hypothetical protein